MTGELSLDLKILLPDVEEETDTRATRLIEYLSMCGGICSARIDEAKEAGGRPVRIRFLPTALTPSEVAEIATDAGAKITRRYGRMTMSVEAFTNQRRARAVCERLRTEAGVVDAEVSADGAISIDFDRTKTSEADIRSLLKVLNLRGIHSRR